MTLDAGIGTASTDSEAPDNSGTQGQPNEVTLLRSRASGLDAKVTSLTQAAKDAIARAEAAEARALELAQAKEGGDAELRAQLKAQELLLAAAATDAKLARIEAKYPETFGVLGAVAAALTDDQLAASEARYAGVAPESPTPNGTNPARAIAAGTKAIEDMTAAELRNHLRTGFDPSVMFPNNRD